MKINMPITEHEIMMVDGQTLVSKTNLKGAITYVNPDFITISGFTEQELLGMNHNIVRHPDMLPEAFGDLWETIKAGKAWTGIIKNRCKNGDFYWVKANVTPIWEKGEITAYMSVRSKPTREEISAAEATYVQIKNGALKIKAGYLIKSGLRTKLPSLSNIKLTRQFALLGVIFTMLSALVLFSLKQQSDQIEFSKQELVGVEYIQPIRQLLQFMPQHRGMTNAYINGDASFKSKILQTQHKLDELFDLAQTIDKELNAKLDTTKKFTPILNDWNTLKHSALTMRAEQSFDAHSALIEKILALIIHAGDTSNLILDPELGSFYAMDLVINKLPALVEYMGQTRGLGTGLITKDKVDQGHAFHMTELKVGVNVNYKGSLNSYRSGAAFDDRLKQRLGPLAKDIERIIGNFILSVDKVRIGDIDNLTAKAFFAEGSQGINKAFDLYDESTALLTELLEERVTTMNTQFYIISISTIISIIITFLLGGLLSRNILSSIQSCLTSFSDIADGNYRKDIVVSGNNELSSLLYSLKSMQIKMGFDVENAHAIANEASRIKQALDVCNTNVMVADGNMNIIYLNSAVQQMFANVEEDIKQDLPDFDASQLLGANADIFHKNPGHQRQVIEQLSNTYKSRVTTGGRIFDLAATPIMSETNKRLGTVVEWADMTEELARIEEERKISDANARMKQALDSVSANVMVADANLDIIYMNNAVIQTLRNAETSIRSDISQFSVDSLIGTNIDIFHKNPAHQRAMLEHLNSEISADILIGGRNMTLVVNPILSDDDTRIGTVVEWSDMTEELARIEKERVISDNNARMKQALDTVSANVMVADRDRNIIYMNKAVTDTLTHAESDIRKDLSNFSVQELIGGSIDVFHKNPEHQKQLLENLSSEYNANLLIGGRHMDLVVNPINNDQHERIGTVVEWTDRTIEVGIEQEIDTLVDASANGDLSKRINPEGKTGFFAKLANGLNQTVESTDSFLKDMGQVLSTMSEGNLTKTIDNDYHGSFGRLKEDVNSTVGKLTEIITQIRETTSLVHSAASEISQGNADLSQRTESQASSLEETAASMEEITSTVKKSSENAMQANSVSRAAKQTAVKGGEVVSGAVHAMTEILSSSHKISDIIGVIDEIAFQTNLLALNAAVEAARAGEHGRGFAVVAGEVRTLSQRSASAAKEIKDLIRESVTKVESGSQLVNQSGDTLADIVRAVEEVAVRVEEIANTAAEQNDGISQINQAVSQMDDMTQQNAALVEEATASSEALSEQASGLNNLVGFFTVGGFTATPQQSPAASTPEAFTQAPAPEPAAEVIKYNQSNKAFGASSEDDWEDF